MATAPTLHIQEERSTTVKTADVQRGENGLFACPECHEAKWKHRAGLAGHRSAVHGIRGTHPSTLRINAALRLKKKNATPIHAKPRMTAQTTTHGKRPRISLSEVKLAADGKFHCSECGAPAKTKGLLRSHLRIKHSITDPYIYTPPKKSAQHNLRTTRHILTSDIKPIRGQYHCPECPAAFSLPRSLGKHRSARHGIRGAGISSLKRQSKQLQLTNRRDHGNLTDHAAHPAEYISPQQDDLERQILYLGGIEEGRLQVIADSQGIPQSILRSGVAELLRRSENGRPLGRQINKVSPLRGQATA